MSDKALFSCWSNWEEWCLVYKLIFDSNDILRQVEGLRIIDVWRSRSEAKLPIAVDCTSCLIASDLGPSSQDPCQVSKRLAIAMALVRFVNGMVDQVQKGIYARSVQSIADEIGIPDWLVDLRHEATHSSLPSMEILQASLHTALSWLKTHYWEKTFSSIGVSESNFQQEICAVLKQYSNFWPSNKPKKVFLDSISADIARKLSSREFIRTSLLPVLVKEDALLIPSQNHLQELSERGSKDPVQDYIEFWRPLLVWIQRKNDSFLIELIDFLLSHMEKECISTTNQKVLNSFIMNFLPDLQLLANGRSFRDKLLRHCLANPSSQTKDIFENIANALDIGQDRWVEIKQLFQAIEPFNDVFSCEPLTKNTDVLVSDYDRLQKCFAKNPIQECELNVQNIVCQNNDGAQADLKSWDLVENACWNSIEAGILVKNLGVVANLDTKAKLDILPKSIDTEILKNTFQHEVACEDVTIEMGLDGDRKKTDADQTCVDVFVF